MDPTILYEDDDFLIVNKPVTLAVQPDKGNNPNLLEILEKQGKTSLFLVNRIDRPASGIVAFAKTSTAANQLNQQFQNRTVEKYYLAIVKKQSIPAKGELTHFLLKNQKKNRSFAFTEDRKNARKAILRYEVLTEGDNYNLLKISLLTGRHHQIRAQLSAFNCPIKGDVKYGSRRGNQDRSIYLHASEMTFHHPKKREKITVNAPLPEDDLWKLLMP